MDIREIMILNINTDISGRQAGEQYSHTLLQVCAIGFGMWLAA